MSGASFLASHPIRISAYQHRCIALMIPHYYLCSPLLPYSSRSSIASYAYMPTFCPLFHPHVPLPAPSMPAEYHLFLSIAPSHLHPPSPHSCPFNYIAIIVFSLLNFIHISTPRLFAYYLSFPFLFSLFISFISLILNYHSFTENTRLDSFRTLVRHVFF